MSRILIVDDHHLVREGLRVLLEQDPVHEVVGEASQPDEALAAAVALQPDIVLLDIGLGEEDGVGLVRLLTERLAQARVLVLSMFSDGETVRQALLAGAAGYLVKGASVHDLRAAIGAVMRGERYLHSSVTGVMVDDGLRWLRSGDVLSPREREVMRLLAAGRTAGSIAGSLGISVHTVRRHLANSAAKLDLHGTYALRAYAVTHGFGRPLDLRGQGT